MGKMAWLSHLIETENKKELIDFLGEKGFKDPKFAAKEFLRAANELKEDKRKKDEEI